MKTKIIVCENVPKLGQSGEIKEVSAGFARNYLLPRGLAMLATPANMRKWESEKKVREIRMVKNLEQAQKVAAELENLVLEVSGKSGREGHLFGAITNQQISDELKKKGVIVEKKQIAVAAPIKTLGEHQVTLKLHGDISVAIKVVVQAENAEALAKFNS